MAERGTREPIGIGELSLPIFETGRTISEDELHELRVRIPTDLHRQLLSLKVLRGRSLADTVSKALEVYFQERAVEAPADEPGAQRSAA